MSNEQSAAATAFARQRAAMAVIGTTAPEKAVLLVLSIMANEAGAAWPPIAGPTGIAAKASLSRRGVQEALRSLETKGYVSREDRPGKGAVYTLLLEVRAGRACAPDAHVREVRGGCAPGAPKQPENNHRKKTSSSPSKPKRETGSMGTRLAPDFEPPADWIAWAAAERGWTSSDATAEADEFRDYWIAQPGVKGRKADWAATWRTWVRRSRRASGAQHGQRADRMGGRGGAGYVRDRPVDGFTAALREAAARRRADDAGGG